MIVRLLLSTLVVALSACASEPADVSSPEAASVATQESPVAAVPAETTTAARDTLVVYKSASCGCCRLWGEHMQGEGFAVVSRDVTNLQAVKDSLGVPPTAGSCHTATVDGYVVEGHVPATTVRRMLRDRPDARGLAVPGMPIGSPGMEQGPRRDPYDVLLVATDGSTSIYESIPGHSAP